MEGRFYRKHPRQWFQNKGVGGYMINYKDMSYEELDAVYKELIEEIAFVMQMKILRKQIDAGKQASAEILT